MERMSGEGKFKDSQRGDSTMIENMKFDFNEKNNLGRDERMMILAIAGGPMPRLDYPTEPLKMANGCIVEKYVIPDEDRRKVLKALYPFADTPSLDEVMVDIHTKKEFKVGEYMVTREGDGNFLVTPYYAEAGGTVLDWISPESSKDGVFFNKLR